MMIYDDDSEVLYGIGPPERIDFFISQTEYSGSGISPQRHLFSGIDFQDLFNLLFFGEDMESCLFIEDEDRHFVWMNDSLQNFLGVMNHDYTGTRDADYFSSDLTQRYLEEEKGVMSAGIFARNQPWIVPDRSGNVYCYSRLIYVYPSDSRYKFYGIQQIIQRTSPRFWRSVCCIQAAQGRSASIAQPASHG